MIQRLQHGHRAQRLDCGLHGSSGQKRLNHPRQQPRRHAMPRQHRAEENAEGAPAPAPPGAIRAKHPVPAPHALAPGAKTLARKRAVAVERAARSAMRATPLLQEKSVASRASASHTKRRKVAHMPHTHNTHPSASRAPKLAAQPTAPRAGGTGRRGLGSRGGIFHKNRDGADGTFCSRAPIINQPTLTTALRHKNGTSYDDNADRNTYPDDYEGQFIKFQETPCK